MSERDIVISGMSGRFPISRNVEELANNLYAGVDMVTSSEGILNDFDGQYFGFIQQMIEEFYPQSRLLLETIYQALRSVNGRISFGIMGNSRSLLENGISVTLDYKEPSMITDTACSAILNASNLAMNDLRLGHSQNAIVGGTHTTLEPYNSQMQQQMGISSPPGISAVLDKSADGFVKRDASVCLQLQKSPRSKRVYATVVSSRMNSGGKKRVGTFYPTSESQERLMDTALKSILVLGCRMFKDYSSLVPMSPFYKMN